MNNYISSVFFPELKTLLFFLLSEITQGQLTKDYLFAGTETKAKERIRNICFSFLFIKKIAHIFVHVAKSSKSTGRSLCFRRANGPVITCYRIVIIISPLSPFVFTFSTGEVKAFTSS